MPYETIYDVGASGFTTAVSRGSGVYRGEYELSWNNRAEVLRLAVAPQEVPEISRSGNNVNYVTTDVGTYKAIGEPGLIKLTLKSFFPNQYYTFCQYRHFPTPERSVEMIKKWQKSKRPIRLIITGLLNDAFAIESFSYYKELGTGDIYFTLELEQYRFAEAGQAVNTSFNKDEMITFVQLKKGQTLCELAEEWLGDSDRYQDIADWNGIEDVGHPWNWNDETKNTLQIICEEGTPGYDRLTNVEDNGKGFG